MRAFLCALALGIGIFGLGMSAADAAAAKAAVPQALSGVFAEPVHCRVYPHRHRQAKPHGFSRGCPKRVRPARGRRA